MRDFGIKFRHIIHNRDIGMFNLVGDSTRVLKKVLEENGFLQYKIPGVCDGIGKKDDQLWVVLGNQSCAWDDPNCPLSDLQKVEIFINKIRHKAQVTLDNIINAYNKAMKNLVKNAMKEFPKYFEPGKYVQINLGKYGTGFGCSEPDQYYFVYDGKQIPWNGEQSPLDDTQRMEIYNILKEEIY